ncbi:InlB B-repeat-containing protein [Anaerofustis stercorihominis]|uniref:Bacterial repeat domain-containing protein n=1 Tax=Anaerofustis stercorihominis TaxID=214853 RepID=A0A3E3DVX7_9FIRM|nr:InlB B-repeat-containing protein [Anaerofustis stercorihominis]RGD73373.1 hypothetical protein DW687_10055 [Anaerofustis stercorihominis]
MNKKIKKSFVVLMILSLCFSFSFQNISAQTLDENNNENISNKITQSEDDVGNNTVTGFEDLEEKIITINEKTDIEKLNLPDKLYVYLNNKEEKTSLDVSWECPDYDKKELSSYIFKPLFEDKYKISQELSEENIPTIEVKINKDIKTEQKNNNTKSIISKSKKVQSIPNEYKIGKSGDYKDFTEALNALTDNAGDVIFNVTDTLYTGYDYKTVEVPTDKGITSLTIKTDLPSVTVDEFNRVSLFLNGIKFTLDSNIDMGSTIYGGGNGKDITSNVDITINQNSAVTNLYGGSKNANLTGDTNITVKGSVNANLVGGCLSSATADNINTKADMYGSSKITIEETGQARSVFGGSMVTVPTSGDVKLTSESSISGSVELLINGMSEEVFGGGHSGPSSYVYGTTNTTCSNTVGGDISIIFTGSAKGANDSEMELYGGGRAMGTQSDTNHSSLTVKGNIYIEAMEDNNASVSQEDNQAFIRFFGGGQALYSNAILNVEGNVTVKSARVCWESSMGTVGGGYASWGGTANVAGKTKLDLYKVENQIAGYENVNLVIGGGLCEYSPNGSNSSATVGNTEITIHKGTTLISGNNSNLNIVGGGYTRQQNANVDVKGSTSIKLEDDLNFQRGICAGGALMTESCKNSSANVGSTNLEFGNNIKVSSGYIIGGGYINTAENASAKVIDDININYGNANLSANTVIGGSFVTSGSGDISIGKEKDKYAITATSKAGFKAYHYIGGSFVQKNKDDVVNKIIGNIKNALDGSNLSFFIGGGELSTSNTISYVEGDIINDLKNFTLGNTSPGGNVYSNNTSDPGILNISGNVNTILNGITLNNPIYTGGANYCNVNKDASLKFKDCTINSSVNALGTTSSSIKGNSIISLSGTTTSNNYIYSYQGNATVSAGKVLVEAGDNTESQTKAYVMGIYSTDPSKTTDVKIYKNAQLILKYNGSDSPFHLMGINDMDIDKNGDLITYSATPASISGNLSGEGTITMPVGGKIIGSGTLGGNLTLKTTGTLNKDLEFFEFDKSSTGKVNFTDPDYKYYLKKEIGSDKAIWVLKEGIIINTNTPDNGTITPGGKQMIGKDEPTEFTFTPDYGYQLDDVKVNGVSVKSDVKKHEDLRSSIYTLTTDINTSLEVSFRPLDKDTMEDIINNLPQSEGTTNPSEDEIDKIFDAKLDYEALSEDEKNKIDENSSDKLHEELLKATEIEVELSIKVSTSGNDAIKISDEQKKRFLYTLDKDDIKELKDNNSQLLKIVIEIKDIEKLEDEEKEKIDNVLSDYTIGKHFVVEVIKEKYQNKDDDTPKTTEKITSMPKSVDITFKVPNELKPKDNTIYAYAMIHTHLENGNYNSTLLEDKDTVDETVTISTNKFSTYTMVYKVRGTKPIVSYTVKFDTRGGSYVKSQNIEENGVITIPDDPTKKGYIFTGWYTDEKCTDLWDFERGKVTKDITLYAGWEKSKDNENPAQSDNPNNQSSGKSDGRIIENNKKNNTITPNTRDENNLDIWIGLSIFTLAGCLILSIKAKKYN